jgi:hypothetical protein
VNHKKLRETIREAIIEYKTTLYLYMWDITSEIVDAIQSDNNIRISADCNCNWKYLEATIRFSELELKFRTKEEIKKIVLHEMIHIVVNEMREEGIDHEERVVSHLTLIANYLTTTQQRV